MVTNRVKEAVEEYERVVKKAAAVYEDALRKAELDLKTALSSSDDTLPPADSGDVVTMDKGTFESLQEQLKVVKAFIEKHPELR